MKTRIWLALIIVAGMIACGKDKFQTIPQLRLISKTPDVVPVNGTLRLNIEYTDKEGDVSDSLFIVRQRLNVRGPVQLLNQAPMMFPISLILIKVNLKYHSHTRLVLFLAYPHFVFPAAILQETKLIL